MFTLKTLHCITMCLFWLIGSNYVFVCPLHLRSKESAIQTGGRRAPQRQVETGTTVARLLRHLPVKKKKKQQNTAAHTSTRTHHLFKSPRQHSDAPCMLRNEVKKMHETPLGENVLTHSLLELHCDCGSVL